MKNRTTKEDTTMTEKEWKLIKQGIIQEHSLERWGKKELTWLHSKRNQGYLRLDHSHS